ncbi:sugar transferase [Pedobacter sp. UC225_65]|uniref:sugar transferase n=1 Tax=Pedobacter sp. UC225_65 TaxID=3350173 RepID=UPI003670A260
MKRLLDVLLAAIGLLMLLPFLILISIVILVTSKGPALYKQVRVGQYNKDFKLLKFRTMYPNAEKDGLLTLGEKDTRITPIGYFLRKFKLDELPQLINVLIGDMSLVGPRPEVRKYVEMYTPAQLKVLTLKPGITDMASIKYVAESAILANYKNPEQAYIDFVMPDKIKINLESMQMSQSAWGSLQIIGLTIRSIFKGKS